LIIADIPGLIEGAHKGTGLGRGFLRHVERCKILIHVIDGSGVDPVKDYITINKELLLFSSALASKPQIVVLNKIDLPEVLEKSAKLQEELKEVMMHNRILLISAAGHIGLEELIKRSYAFFKKLCSDELNEKEKSLHTVTSQGNFLMNDEEEEDTI
jgi:GTP-binding protein